MDDFTTSKILDDPDYQPYCLRCSTMRRMIRNGLTFTCANEHCDNKFTVEATFKKNWGNKMSREFWRGVIILGAIVLVIFFIMGMVDIVEDCSKQKGVLLKNYAGMPVCVEKGMH